MQFHLQTVMPEQPAVVLQVVVCNVEIAVRPEAFRDDQVMRFIA